MLVRYGLPKIKDILPVESGSLKFKGFTCGIWVAQDQRFYLWNLGRSRSKVLPVESGSLKIKGFTCGIWVAQDQRFYLWNLGRSRSKVLPVESGSLKIKGFTCGILVTEDLSDYLWNLGNSRSWLFYMWNLGKVILTINCAIKGILPVETVTQDQGNFICGIVVRSDFTMDFWFLEIRGILLVETGSSKINLWILGQSR